MNSKRLTRLLTTEAAADLLGIKGQTLRLKRMHGTGPPFVRLGNQQNSRAAYRESDLARWIAKRPTFSSTHEEKVAANAKAGAK